jgi:hypothetical protein
VRTLSLGVIVALRTFWSEIDQNRAASTITPPRSARPEARLAGSLALACQPCARHGAPPHVHLPHACISRPADLSRIYARCLFTARHLRVLARRTARENTHVCARIILNVLSISATANSVGTLTRVISRIKHENRALALLLTTTTAAATTLPMSTCELELAD